MGNTMVGILSNNDMGCGEGKGGVRKEHQAISLSIRMTGDIIGHLICRYVRLVRLG